MKKIRYFLNLSKEYLRRRYRLVIFGIILGVVFFSLAPSWASRYQLLTSPKKVGVVGKYTVEEIPQEIQSLISRGLTKINKDGQVSPDLAENWQVEEDGKKYIFNLKKNIKWPDGKEFTAQDINYNFEDVEIEINNQYQLTFHLADTFSPFPTAVSKPIFEKGYLGLGDYRVRKIDFNGEFVKNIYLNPVNSSENKKIVYKFYPTEDSAKTALKLGEINELKEIIEPKQLENFPNLEIASTIKEDRFVGLFFNTTNQFLEDRQFRQALAYAIEKNYSQRAISPISPQSWAYFEDVKPYNYDFERAKELMESSLGELDPGSIELTISTVPQLITQAESIKKDWEKLGIKVQILPFKIGETDFVTLLAIQEIPLDPDQYNLWHSTSRNNITRLNSPRIDKLLEDGRKTLDRSERRKIYYDFQRYLTEEVPIVFLYYPEVFKISKK